MCIGDAFTDAVTMDEASLALQREPERVLADIVDGKVTPERARGVYGVVVDVERRRVDEVATNALRARRKGEHDS